MVITYEKKNVLDIFEKIYKTLSIGNYVNNILDYIKAEVEITRKHAHLFGAEQAKKDLHLYSILYNQVVKAYNIVDTDNKIKIGLLALKDELEHAIYCLEEEANPNWLSKLQSNENRIEEVEEWN